MDMKKNIMETLQEFCGREELRDDDVFLYDLGICDRELARIINVLNSRFHITFLESPQDLQFASVNDFINCARVNANG